MALEEFGTQTALIMAFGMVANVLIARFTPLKFIFLTGHHTLYMACMIGIILTVGGLSGTSLVAVGTITLGFIMALFPAIAHPTMKKITGSDDVAFGHFGTIGYIFAAYVGKWLGNKEHTTEEINFPKGLYFLRDSSIAISLVMLVLFLVVALACGPEYVEKNLSGGQSFLVFSIIQAITFAGGVYIILPSVVPHFFCGATAGVFGNATGGLRGAVLGAMAHGIPITFLPVFLMPVLGNLGFANTTFSDADFCIVGTILGNVINMIK